MNMPSFKDIKAIIPIVIFTFVIFFWMKNVIDQKYLIGFLTCYVIHCQPFFDANKLLLYTGRCLTIKTLEVDQQRKHKLNFLVVGRSTSGKSLTVQSFVQRKCEETVSGAPGLRSALNLNSYGWNVYALVCKSLQETVCNLPMDLQSVHQIVEDVLKYDINVVIYCFPFHEGLLNNDDKKIIDTLRAVLGSSVVKSSMILVMTHGEDFKKKKDISLKDWINELEPCILKDVLDECCARCVMFQNKTLDSEKNKKQALELFIMANSVVSTNGQITKKENVRDKDNETTGQFSDEFKLLCQEINSPPLTPSCSYSQIKFKKILAYVAGLHYRNRGKSKNFREDSSYSEENKTFLYSNISLPHGTEKQYQTTDAKYEDDLQLSMIQSNFCILKENIDPKDFTCELFQNGIINYSEKREIDEMQSLDKRKHALFDAIYKNRFRRSFPVFFEVLQRKYPLLYESLTENGNQQKSPLQAITV